MPLASEDDELPRRLSEGQRVDTRFHANGRVGGGGMQAPVEKLAGQICPRSEEDEDAPNG